MVYYLGSKARYADDILKIVLAKRRPQQTYVEPFMGGGNVLCRVPHKQGPRIGADINEYMVAFLKALSEGWQPPEQVSEAEYNRIKKAPDKYPKELVGFVATGATHGSMWMGGYAKHVDKDLPDRVTSSRKAALEDGRGLAGATFVHSTFDKLEIPPASLIYCDPPYNNTAGYASGEEKLWRATKFWQWADKLVDDGHTVFVSEYAGPTLAVYPYPPMGDDEKAVLADMRALQRKIAEKFPDVMAPLPSVYAQRRADLEARIKAYDELRLVPGRKLAARWKVVWEREVVVNFSSDIGEGEGKKVVEKLFHREADA